MQMFSISRCNCCIVLSSLIEVPWTAHFHTACMFPHVSLVETVLTFLTPEKEVNEIFRNNKTDLQCFPFLFPFKSGTIGLGIGGIRVGEDRKKKTWTKSTSQHAENLLRDIVSSQVEALLVRRPALRLLQPAACFNIVQVRVTAWWKGHSADHTLPSVPPQAELPLRRLHPRLKLEGDKQKRGTFLRCNTARLTLVFLPLGAHLKYFLPPAASSCFCAPF